MMARARGREKKPEACNRTPDMVYDQYGAAKYTESARTRQTQVPAR